MLKITCQICQMLKLFHVTLWHIQWFNYLQLVHTHTLCHDASKLGSTDKYFTPWLSMITVDDLRKDFTVVQHFRFWEFIILIVNNVCVYVMEINLNGCHDDLTHVSIDLLKSAEVIQKWNTALRCWGREMTTFRTDSQNLPRIYFYLFSLQNKNFTTTLKCCATTKRDMILSASCYIWWRNYNVD